MTLIEKDGILNLAWSNSGKEKRITYSIERTGAVILDGFDTTKGFLSQFKKIGYTLIGYISVGSLEDWRPDKDEFPSKAIGDDYDGWPGEKWLKVSEYKRFIPIMKMTKHLFQV